MSNQRLRVYSMRLGGIAGTMIGVVLVCWILIAAIAIAPSAAAVDMEGVEIAKKVADYLSKQGHDGLLHALVILSGLCIVALIAVARAAYQIHRDVLAQSRESNAATNASTAANNRLAEKIHDLTDELKSRPCIAPRQHQ